MIYKNITLETDAPIPEGYEIVKVTINNNYLLASRREQKVVGMNIGTIIDINEVWKPPVFLKSGWIAQDQDGRWFWYSDEPENQGAGWDIDDEYDTVISLECFNWSPPVVADWTESLIVIN